eukprot:293759-Amphidinium_carterae.1
MNHALISIEELQAFITLWANPNTRKCIAPYAKAPMAFFEKRVNCNPQTKAEDWHKIMRNPPKEVLLAYQEFLLSFEDRLAKNMDALDKQMRA